MSGGSSIALALLGLTLGLRHGIDWDHIAAITDITSSVATGGQAPARTIGRRPERGGRVWALEGGDARSRQEARVGFFLATLYALGHASVVVVLGLLAIQAGAILPAWIDHVMERVVGGTLVVLGVWIFLSLWRDGRAFQLRSRWMVVFAIVSRVWNRAQSSLTGSVLEHSHSIPQYGSRTAFGIGMIHGVGAETGSQALLLAGAAGATTPESSSLLLFSFVAGLVISNSLIAAFSVAGLVSARVKQDVYLAIGILAGGFSLLVGAFFLIGRGASLPDVQRVFEHFAGR